MDIIFSITNDAYHAFKRLAKVLANEKNYKVVSIQSGHGGEFQNEKF